MSETNKSFEEKMNRLEEIVSEIDNGKTTLDKNLELYLEGTKLIQEIEKTLNDAKEKIKKINEK